jgi:hypothetical protein
MRTMAKVKNTNNDLQNTTQKIKDRATEHRCLPGVFVVPALLVVTPWDEHLPYFVFYMLHVYVFLLMTPPIYILVVQILKLYIIYWYIFPRRINLMIFLGNTHIDFFFIPFWIKDPSLNLKFSISRQVIIGI